MALKALLILGVLGVELGATPVQFPLPLPLPLPLPMEGTPEDRAACESSVRTFCQATLNQGQDSMRVLSCLQQNRQRIAPACRAVLVKYGQ